MPDRMIQLTCPRCGKVHAFAISEGVDVSKNPELRLKVLDASIFCFPCPDCGFEQWALYPFLYHDPSHRFIIQLVEPSETGDPFLDVFNDGTQSDEALKKAVADMKNRYIMRVVTTPNELMEKILMFEAGFDDRLLEIYKHELIAEENKRVIRHLWFEQTKDKGPIFHVEEDAGMTGFMLVRKERYEALQHQYESVVKDRSEIRINPEWVIRVIHKA